jgi:non-ribosomal peptide synthetase-like protein
LSGPERARAFAKLWTLKEAYAKLTGTGLAADFRFLEFGSGPELSTVDCQAQHTPGETCFQSWLTEAPGGLCQVAVAVGGTEAVAGRGELVCFAVDDGVKAMGYFLIVAAAPAVALVVLALAYGGPWWGVAAAFATVPLEIIWYVVLLVAVKRICIGRIEPGLYPLESTQYLRYWFLSYLLDNTRMLLLPIYATVYLPPPLRWLGASIGRDTEVSTVTHVTPDLLSVGDGCFLADACLVGGCRVHHGHVEIGGNRIGEKTFIGNSAMLPGGSDVGSDALLGVLSAPTSGQTLPNDERWLGAPAFALPAT